MSVLGTHHLPKAFRSPYINFVRHPPILLSLNPTLIPLVGKCHGPFPIHISMILFTLGLSLHGFVIGLSPERPRTNLILSILINLLIPNRCGTLWDFEHTPNNPPLKQSSIGPPLKPGFSFSFIAFGYTPCMKHQLPRAHRSPYHFCLASTHIV